MIYLIYRATKINGLEGFKMDWLVEFLVLAIGIPLVLAGYVYLAGLIRGMQIFPRRKSKDMEATNIHAVEGALWPVFLPVVAICLLFSFWVKAMVWLLMKADKKGSWLGATLSYSRAPDHEKG